MYGPLQKTLTITLTESEIIGIVRAISQRLIPWAKNYCEKIESKYTRSEVYHKFLRDFKSEIDIMYKFHNWETDREIEDFQKTIFNLFAEHEIKKDE